MNLIFFASFIIFGCWLTYELHKSRKKDVNAEFEFWQKESLANSVRKKNLDHLPYVKFPFDKLPSSESFDNEEIPESLSILNNLRKQKILNLNGMSNTDLKLTYGAPNLNLLSEYDNNYATFIRNIYSLSETLYKMNRIEEAQYLLEQALETGSDSSLQYRLLAKIYREQQMNDKISSLRQTAEKIDEHSIMKNTILNIISEYEQSN